MPSICISGGVERVLLVRPPVVEPPPEPLPSPLPALSRLWDGTSGATGLMYDRAGLIAWTHKGGDWRDATGALQGATPYATAAWAAGVVVPARLDLDITAFVAARLDAGIITPFARVVRGVTTVATRRNVATALRPHLVLLWGDGTSSDAECVASASLNASTVSGITTETVSMQTGAHLALQFALPASDGRTLQRATLTLTATKVWERTTVEVHEVDCKHIGTRGVPRMDGIASRYPGDVGIERDPDILTAYDFQDARFGALPTDAVIYRDPDLGLPAAKMQYHVNEFSPWAAQGVFSTDPLSEYNVDAMYAWCAKERVTPPTVRPVPHPESYPRDLYLGYYIWLDPDYQCPVEGKKLPGWDFRLGYLKSGSGGKWYWQNVDGNGGGACRGRYITTYEDPTKPTFGQPLPQPYFSGGSIRCIGVVGSPEVDHPRRGLVPIASYAYYCDQPNVPPSGSQYGEGWPWGTDLNGYPALEPNRWYWVELHLRMNSCVGPYDEWMNGTGVKDGVFEAWLDGVPMIKKDNIRFIHNPLMGISSAWLDHYHGGTTVTEARHGFRMARVRIARNYIGPLKR